MNFVFAFTMIAILMIFLIVSSIIVYRERSWRLMEFMFVLVMGTMPGGLCLKYFNDRGALIGRDWDIITYVMVLSVACFALILAGAINGLWYADKLQVQVTGIRLLLIVFGILQPAAFSAGVLSFAFLLRTVLIRNVKVEEALGALLVFLPCGAIVWARLRMRRRLGLPMFDPKS